MGCAIRRLLRSAETRGLPLDLTMETATAFAEDLMRGDLQTISAAGYCDFLACVARHAGYPNEIFEALMKTHRALKVEAKGDLRRKEIKLAQVPIDLADLAKTARELLEHAPLENDIRNRRRDYTLAGAMALLCKLQIRAKDLREGEIGKEFSRDSEGWLVDLATSKTGTRISGRLAECLTPYLDAVLLMDTDPAHLWTIYDQRLGTALFANPARDWKCYECEWLRRNMTERTGHSAHIVRTLIYDYCALSDDLDAKVNHPDLDIAFKTIHSSKGLEADHVVVLQVFAGRIGFPSEIVDDPLLTMVSPETEPFEHAEERRVMYVAMTRARKSLTVMGSAARQSTFVEELLGEVEYEVAAEEATIARSHICGDCQGHIFPVPKKNGGMFYRCEHVELCGNTLPSMLRVSKPGFRKENGDSLHF